MSQTSAADKDRATEAPLGARSKDELDFSYTQNRELSWLQFDNRVLDESLDEKVPLLERYKMASIFESNLDEFFMIRVGSLSELASLKVQPVENKSNQTPAQQEAAIYEAVPPLTAKHGESVARIEESLAELGVTRVRWEEFTDADRVVAENFFADSVLPIVSPQIIDPRHPFPNLRNLTNYAVFNLRSPSEPETLGLIEIPPTLPRAIKLGSPRDRGLRYTLLEDVMLQCSVDMFGEYRATERAVIRVTRNADIDPDEGSFDMEEDYRSHMKKILKQRLRLNPVRLEVQGEFSKNLVKRIRKSLELSSSQVFRVTTPLGMGGYVFGLEGMIPDSLKDRVCYPPFSPQQPDDIDPSIPVWKQVRKHDIILFYPYETMDPFLRLIHESALDPEVMQIKITLYRVAKKSRLCESLIAAAENGVDVTVLMELRARFDEENNIEWAERLEDAGCTVLYGTEGFKVHSKICQITRRSDGEVLRITQLGTGNYNEKTAGLYADYSLMTCDPGIGDDANRFFRNLQIGNLQGEYHTLGVAPVSLKPLIMRGLSREIEKAREGGQGYCLFKMNSLTDREVIDKISEASCAGVHVDMIIRGICCLLPGIPGKTENVRVRAIVGRMLEHARAYCFGSEFDTIYLSSADMMTRNTEHRVEIAYPLLDPAVRERVRADVLVQLADNVKGRELGPDGLYHKIEVPQGGRAVDSQLTFMRRAEERAAAVQRRQFEARSGRRHVDMVAPASEEPAPAPEPVPTPEPVLAVEAAPAPEQTPAQGIAGEPAAAEAQGAPAAAAEATAPAEESPASHVAAPSAGVATETAPASAAAETASASAAAPEAQPAAVEPSAAAAEGQAAPLETDADQLIDQIASEFTHPAAREGVVAPQPSGTSQAAADAAVAERLDALMEQVGSMRTKLEELERESRETVTVQATPLPDDETSPSTAKASSSAEEAGHDAGQDAVASVELMVRKRGRSATGWALIRAGLRVLLRGGIKKGE